ncbi:hypothetical protein [Nodularia chucula]|uniref:hypothetical protein n=1 Tax=Nodularia chucula TaxID=3093667 RepID=UPI0039C72081
MATFTFAPTNSSFVRNLAKKTLTLEGREGKQLSDQINQVTENLKSDESIQRLLNTFEEENQQRHQKLLDYIQSLHSEAIAGEETEFTLSVLKKAEQVWDNLRSVFSSQNKCLEVPDACPGYNDNFMYTWSKGEHYLECEIFGSGEVEFFYRTNNDVWGEDIKVGQEFSTAIIEKVALFTW